MKKKFIPACAFLFAAFIVIGIYSSAFAQDANGYENLFNGKTLSGWKVMGSGADFRMVNGTVIGTSKQNAAGGYLVTEKEYSDFVLELDVRTTGNMTNTGIAIRGQFDPSQQSNRIFTGKEIAINAGTHQWAGGIYDNGRNRGWLYPLDLNAKAKSAYKAGMYNHIKIECTGNETRTWVNGVAAADLVDTVDQNGFIGLCVQGNTGAKIYFKNIRIKTKNISQALFPKGIYVMNFVPNSLTAYEKQNGWKLLFDGQTSAGWKSPTKPTFPAKTWIIHNGIMTVTPAVKDEPSGGDIITDRKYRSFDLSFEFKTTPVANSGVKYFVYVDEKNGPLGLEYQVLDDGLNPDAKLGRNGDRTEASLYDLIPAKKDSGVYRPVGQWNTGRILVYPDNHVEHYLNGVKVLEYNRLSPEFAALIAISKYKNYKGFGTGPEGYILLQEHGTVVSFRSIKIREF